MKRICLVLTVSAALFVAFSDARAFTPAARAVLATALVLSSAGHFHSSLVEDEP